MLEQGTLNSAFDVVAKWGTQSEPYAKMAHMAVNYSVDKVYNAIYQIVTKALDCLEDDKPMSVVDLNRVMDGYVDTYQQYIKNTYLECAAEHVRVRDLERSFAEIMGIDLEKTPINFRNHEGNIKVASRLKLKPEAKTLLEEIAVSNRVIELYRSDISELSDQLEAFQVWRCSDEAEGFIKAYASVRIETVMAGRKVVKAAKFANEQDPFFKCFPYWV